MDATEAAARIGAALSADSVASSDYDLNPGIELPPGRKLRTAAVLVAVADTPQGAAIVLTKRSSRLRNHPGQIAFPGGRADPGDADAEATALREAHEEIALPPDRVELLGRLARHETVTGFLVTPVLGRITAPFTPAAEPGEVAEIFTVPFAHIANPANYSIEWRFWRGQKRHYFTVPWGPYYVWGATARMLHGLAERLARTAP